MYQRKILVAVVAGTKSEDVIGVLRCINEEKRFAVEEVTLDLSDSMRKIVRSAFPKARRVIDRFHIQKLACDAVQELPYQHRWNAIQQANDDVKKPRLNSKEYVPYRYPNGDTRRNCLYAHVICCLSLPTSGLRSRNKEQKSYLKNTLT